MLRKPRSKLTNLSGFGVVSLLVGLAIAIITTVIVYVGITRFGSNFLNNFLSIISQQRPSAPGSQPYTQPVTQPSTSTPTPGERIVIFEDLGEAIKSGLGLKCEFTSAGAQHTAYVKDGKARTDSSAVGEVGAMGIIVRDYSMWTWIKSSKEGIMATYTKESLDKMLESGDGESPSDFRCWEEIINDTLFVPPSDVAFYDAGGFTQ